MGFKMNGSPAKMGTIQGTAGHSSALKMKVEENASALKQKAYGGAGKTWGEYDKASGGALNTDTKTQKEYEAKMRKENKNWDKKKDNTWKTQQNKINKHVGSKVVHSVDEIKNNIEATATNGGNETTATNGGNETTGTNGGNETNNNNKITPTNDAQVFSSLSNTSTIKKGISEPDMLKIEGKSEKRQGEHNENLNKAKQKNERKDAEALYGKDSSKYQQERIQELDAKRADRMGEQGGKKQMWGLRQINNLVGNIRTKNALKKGLKARAKEEAAAGAANNSAAKYHSPAKQNIFAEGNNPKKTIEEEASDYRKNTKNRDKTKVDPITQKYVDYVNTKVGVGGGPKRDKYGNLIK
jgi:hypothetical protein